MAYYVDRKMKGKISEIFYSIQGEGIYQGIPQVFVRFWGCDVGCHFCDTRPAGYRDMGLDEVVGEVFRRRGFWDSVAFTGGEPLLQAEALGRLASHIKGKNKRTYLETNGILPGRLKEVIDFIDIIAMDFKLPSSTKVGEFWGKHSQFLRQACRKEVFVKAVVTLSTLRQDIIRAARIINEVDRNVFFVLQPAFAYEALLWERLEGFKSEAQKLIPNVRVIPQIHKHIGVR